MVYRVLGNFTDENLEEIVNKLSEKFKFIYKNESFYIVLGNYNNEVRKITMASMKDNVNNGNLVIEGQRYETKEEIEKRLTQYLKREVFIPEGDFWIKAIHSIDDAGSIQDSTGFVKQWLEENLVRLDKERLEIENQEKLKEVWKQLDKTEKIIEDELRKIAGETVKNKDK